MKTNQITQHSAYIPRCIWYHTSHSQNQYITSCIHKLTSFFLYVKQYNLTNSNAKVIQIYETTKYFILNNIKT